MFQRSIVVAVPELHCRLQIVRRAPADRSLGDSDHAFLRSPLLVCCCCCSTKGAAAHICQQSIICKLCRQQQVVLEKKKQKSRLWPIMILLQLHSCWRWQHTTWTGTQASGIGLGRTVGNFDDNYSLSFFQ